MKTIIKSILVVAVMFGTSLSYGNETLDVLPKVKLVNEGDHISITDALGDVIFSGRIKRTGDIVKLFDFIELKDGIYKVEIGKAFEIETLKLQVNNKNVAIVKDSQEKIFKPVIRTEESQLIVSKIALDSNKMNIKLYFEGELIYTEAIESREKILNRVYRLDSANPGNYKAIIRTNNREYVQNFKI